MIRYLGSLSTAQLVPTAAASLSAAVLELRAQVTALLEASATVSPGGLAATIALGGTIIAALEAAVTAGVTPPSISFQASGIFELQVKLEALLALQNLMAAGGIHALAYRGRADDFASELAGAVAGLPGVQPSDGADAIALIATTPAAIEALRAVFAQ